MYASRLWRLILTARPTLRCSISPAEITFHSVVLESPHHLLGLLVGEPLPHYLRLHLSSLRLRLSLLVSIVVIL